MLLQMTQKNNHRTNHFCSAALTEVQLYKKLYKNSFELLLKIEEEETTGHKQNSCGKYRINSPYSQT
jgi:hypothetical protein